MKTKPIQSLRMVKAVIDTNVFISGILFGGIPRKVVQTILTREYIFCLSPELKAEILIKLDRKFLLAQSTLLYIEELLDTYGHKYNPDQKITICKDPGDNFLLELAEKAKADFLVSGDKLVLELNNHKNTNIISPREFLDLQRAA